VTATVNAERLADRGYDHHVVHAGRSARFEEERRRSAAERTRGMFAHLAQGRNLSDELIADRRAEAEVEAREATEEAQRLRGTRWVG
jgi:hypothetical protein